MLRINEFEKKFYTVLSALCFLALLLCIVFPGASFGILFFSALAIGAGGLRFLMYISEKGGKRAHMAAVLVKIGRILFLLWLISFIIIEVCIWCVDTRTVSDAEEKDYVLVLGAGLYGDKPSLVLQNRLLEAESYLKKYPDTRAVLCGGQGANETVSEAVAMYRWLSEKGIAQGRMILEDASANTLQNISHAKSILENLSPEKKPTTAVISNEFHLFRAKKLMQKAGFEPYAISAPTPYFGLRIIYSIREYFSIMGLILTGQWVF